MTKYPNITVTFTIIPEDVSLKIQATCDGMKKDEILMALDKLKKKIESGDFETMDIDGGYYSESTFPLHEPDPEKEKQKKQDEAWESYRQSIYDASKIICSCSPDKKKPNFYVDGFCGTCANELS